MDKITIKLPDIKKEDVEWLEITLKNCQVFYIFNNEIIDIDLQFHKSLMRLKEHKSYHRMIKSGYVKLKLSDGYDDECNEEHTGDFDFLFSYCKGGISEKITKRLLGICDTNFLGVKYKNVKHRENLYVPYEETMESKVEKTKKIKLTVCSSSEVDSEGNLVIYFGSMSKFTPRVLDHKDIHSCKNLL